ncbi:MAG: hypothetical protein RQ760_08465 [Sedimentisphaerales bacterium]|nr:hypothetical protein [Sedimentisphaerales bacterium]
MSRPCFLMLLVNPIFSAVGFGGNYVTIDQEHDLVVVARWLDPSIANKILMMILNSVESN